MFHKAVSEDDMATATLDQVQQLVDQLSPLEQVKLLEYLTPRIARAVVQQSGTSVAHTQYQDAWAELFRIGEMIAASDPSDTPTLTSTVLSMRR
jgi:hypothetical protein